MDLVVQGNHLLANPVDCGFGRMCTLAQIQTMRFLVLRLAPILRAILHGGWFRVRGRRRASLHTSQ